ncbi:hypothetical protein ACM66B_005722 [Microbotryomycetes sp. NB124-2]
MDIATLEQQLASHDNDRRVQALHSIRHALRDGQHLLDADELDKVVQLVKPLLRHNNQHVVLAALQALPDLLTRAAHVDDDDSHGDTAKPSSVQAALRLDHHFRATLATLLPTDKLADSKQQVRDAAREATIAAARTSLRLTARLAQLPAHQHKDTSWQLVEQRIHEHGFYSKNAKAREQALLFLVAIRQSVDECPPAPLKPFTPLLLPLLGDPDPTVRSLALSSTISIFSATGVSPAAKADLKKSLLKFDVNKKVQDTILAAVLGGGEAHPDTASSADKNAAALDDSSQETRSRPRPPSPSTLVANLPASAFPTDPAAVHSQPTEIQPVYVANERDLHVEIEKMNPCFEGKETEHNWVARDKSIVRLRGLIKGGATAQLKDAFLADLRMVEEGIIKTSSSLRTTLAISALQLMTELSDAFGSALDHHFLEGFLNHCLGMAGQTKKIVATASQATVTSLISNSKYHHKTLLQLSYVMQDKNAAARQFAAAHLQTLVKVHGKQSQHAIESTGGLEEIEQMLKRGLTDANSTVKETSRTTFWVVHEIWPKLADKVSCSLDPTSRKQLDKSDPRKQQSTLDTVNASQAAATAATKAPGAGPTKTARPSVREMMLQAKREKAQKEQEMEAQLAAHADAETVEAVAAAVSSSPGPTSGPSSPNLQRTPSSPVATPLFDQQRPSLPSSPSSPTNSRRASHIPVAIGSHPHRSPEASPRLQQDVSSVHAQPISDHVSRVGQSQRTPAVPRHISAVRQSDVFNDSPDARTTETFGLADKSSDWWKVKGQARSASSNADLQEADNLISQLVNKTILVDGLEKLAELSRRYPVTEEEVDSNTNDASPSQRTAGATGADIWSRDKQFMKVFQALTSLLTNDSDEVPDEQEAALKLLASLVDNQLACLAGEETTVFELLFRLRENPSRSIIAATEGIGRGVTDRSEPLLTLGLLSSTLVQYLDVQNHGQITAIVARSFALGLRLIGRLFARLPREVLEDELPKRAELIKRGLNDAHAELRRASVQCLVDAHSVLRDEEKVYDLVGRTTLHKDQINLLSYYMSKTSVQ